MTSPAKKDQLLRGATGHAPAADTQEKGDPLPRSRGRAHALGAQGRAGEHVLRPRLLQGLGEHWGRQRPRAARIACLWTEGHEVAGAPWGPSLLGNENVNRWRGAARRVPPGHQRTSLEKDGWKRPSPPALARRAWPFVIRGCGLPELAHRAGPDSTTGGDGGWEGGQALRLGRGGESSTVQPGLGVSRHQGTHSPPWGGQGLGEAASFGRCFGVTER